MRTYIAKRNFRSEEEAIKRISSKFGLAKVLKIWDDYLLEEFVDFKQINPSLNQLSFLLKRIHSEKNVVGLSLVHGDFGEHNVTIINGETKCFDYEYSHFGNIYTDIGRVVLRRCNNFDEVNTFFDIYSDGFPSNDKLKNGLIYFCNWQYELRKEKNLPYQQVPLIRAEKIKKINNDLSEILYAFKSRVDTK